MGSHRRYRILCERGWPRRAQHLCMLPTGSNVKAAELVGRATGSVAKRANASLAHEAVASRVFLWLAWHDARRTGRHGGLAESKLAGI